MTDWLSGAAMLICGLIVGFMVIYSFKRKSAPADATPIDRSDLEGRRDSLIQQLRELDESDADERARLEREAANVLRQLEEQAPVPVPAPTRAAARPPAPASALTGFIWGAGSMAALALMVWLVYDQSRPRAANQEITGDLPGATAQQPPAQADPELQQLETLVRTQPANVDARIQLAKAYLDRENLMPVFEHTQFVLQRDPNNAPALTYQAVVRLSMGQTDEAQRMLERAAELDPSLLDALVTLAWVHTLAGRGAEADARIAEAIRQHPEEKAKLEEVLGEMRKRAASAAAAPQQATAQPADTNAIHVTLDASPAVRSRAAAGVVFLIARNEGVTAGPPVAAKRIQVTSLPMTIDLGAADSMMGQALPGRVRVEARLDSDGNAVTKTPGDPFAAQDGVALGSAVTLRLE